MHWAEMLLIFAALGAPAWAGDVQVYVLNPDAPTSEFRKAGFEIHRTPVSKGTALPFRRADREQWLARAGLKNGVQKWDDLDRDLIVIRSRTLSTERFIAVYTAKNLKVEALKALRAITAKEGKW